MGEYIFSTFSFLGELYFLGNNDTTSLENYPFPSHVKNELWTNGNLLRGVEHPLAYFAAVICVNWTQQCWKSRSKTPGPGMSDLVILESFPRQSYESERFALLNAPTHAERRLEFLYMKDLFFHVNVPVKAQLKLRIISPWEKVVSQ